MLLMLYLISDCMIQMAMTRTENSTSRAVHGGGQNSVSVTEESSSLQRDAQQVIISDFKVMNSISLLIFKFCSSVFVACIL